MDVDLGAGLGDELVAFDGFDDLFAPTTGRGGTPDIFKFCALDDGGVGAQAQAQETDTRASATAPTSPGLCSTSWLADGGDRDFAQDDWKRVIRENGSTNLGLGLGGAMLGVGVPAGMGAMNIGGKPRARKRHDEEDEALETPDEVTTRPIFKRRSSATSTKIENVPAGALGTGGRGQQDVKPTATRSHSFHVLASSGWSPRTAATQLMSTGRSHVDSSSNTASLSMQQTTQAAGTNAKYTVPSSTLLDFHARGGAIKVKNDVTSGRCHPRISVFMSKPRPRRPLSSKMASALSLEQPSSLQNLGKGPLVSTASLPGSYSHTITKTELVPAAAISRSTGASRFKDLRIMVGGRTRSQAEQHVVETTPPVVAMGSRRGSSPALDESFAPPPTLQRARSVGALTISGHGEAFCRTLSPKSDVLPAYELSESVQGTGGTGGQRRNLVCKVIGSPVNRPSRPPFN